MKTFKIGDRVRFRSEDYNLHRLEPFFYPVDGTGGTITEIDDEAKVAKVQWAHGSTSGDDEWCAAYTCLELVEE